MTTNNTSDLYSEHDPFYRLGVGMMVVNYSGKVLVCQRSDIAKTGINDAWQMPQGGIDYGEDPLKAALRELKEEIGTDHVSLIAVSDKWYSYDFPANLAKTLWGGRFVGQKQKWFLFRYEGYENEINLNMPHPEFTAYKWVDPSELADLIVDFKRDVYRSIIKEFQSAIEFMHDV